VNGFAPRGKDLFDCSGRVAVVTGPAGFLGPIWARTLQHAGATVVLVAEPGTVTRPEVTELAGTPGVTVLTADTTSTGQLSEARDELAARFGPAHILIASAGVDHPPRPGQPIDLARLTPADIDHTIHVNVTGTLLTVSAFGGPMAKAGRGSIILIGSQYATISPRPQMYDHLHDDGHPFIKNPAYGASKAAVASIARYFAAHWGRHGVRVNALSPGGVRSGQDPEFQRKFAAETPLGRLLEPCELEGPLLFLASDASSYINGAQILVDGGSFRNL
jgi:NAD(P)-dependent dehydrogenase (short-subunit alcohol dehydrogenase family)